MTFSTRTSWVALAVTGPAYLLGTTYFVFVYLESHERGLGFDTAAARVNWTQLCYAAAAMALGLIASYIYRRAAAAGDGMFDIAQTLKDMPRVGRFWMAFAVSPLVFHSVLTGVGDSDLTIIHYLFAFQNGFFWETVLGGPASTPAQTTAADTPPPAQPDAGAVA
jgi:uncharacterized membrane protein (DUF485 family)